MPSPPFQAARADLSVVSDCSAVNWGIWPMMTCLSCSLLLAEQDGAD